MRELQLNETCNVSGGGFLTGLGVFVIFMMVDEIANDVMHIKKNLNHFISLQAELVQAEAIIKKYKLLHGELPD